MSKYTLSRNTVEQLWTSRCLESGSSNSVCDMHLKSAVRDLKTVILKLHSIYVWALLFRIMADSGMRSGNRLRDV